MYRHFALIIRNYLLTLLMVTLIGCEVNYTHDITPMQWYNAPGSTIGAVQFTEEPMPTPTSPFELSPPSSFIGAESLNCTDPYGGDSRYGYCRIPGILQYYVWGECTTPCPDSPYEVIEVLLLDDSNALQTYISVIDERDDAHEDKFTGYLSGGVFGGVGLAGGIVGIGEACFALGSWNYGIGCGIVILVVVSDFAIAGIGLKKGVDANHDLKKPNGLNFSANDLFEIIRTLESAQPQ